MTREEIKEFSGVEPNCFVTDREEDWYRIGCIDGMEAEDANPDTSSIWHDASEEPKENTDILCISTNGNVHKVSKIDNQLYNWLKDNDSIDKWAYISDLLPKGGAQ